ncbi:MAG: histidinol-phosphatase HisJ family protein [Oscillospiraceae bacterium]|nr:histidinol-phosphatase HisJ family protein [Oscillospiraceae bacterium]
MFLADYHTHSLCSPDGHAPLSEMARSGLDTGLAELCLTDHCDLLDYHGNPVHSYNWTPVEEQIGLARPQFEGRLTIKMGLELGEAWENPVLAATIVSHPELDFVLGSVHNLSSVEGGVDLGMVHYESEEQCYRVLDKYFDAMEALVELPCFDILAHVIYPLRYMGRDGFTPSLEPYEARLRAIFTKLVSQGRGIELNTTRGTTVEDWRWTLTLYKNCGGALVTLGSDAHYPPHVAAGFYRAAALLKELGFTHIATYEKHKPTLHEI